MNVRSTPFVQLATTARRVTPGWLAYLLVFLVLILGVQGVVTAILSSAWPVEKGSFEAQLQESITFGVALLGLLAWVTLYERRRFRTLGFVGRGGALKMLLGVVAGAALLSVPVLFLWLTGAYESVDGPADASTGSSWWLWLVPLVLVVLVQSTTEETLTRGFLLQNSGLKLPAWPAVLVPALLFTLVHGVLTDPLPFTMILLFALFASFVVLRQGSLWFIAGLHAGWNLAQGNLYGIPVSGLAPNSTSLLFLQPAADAPDWLTGGDFGAEASLPAVVVLLVVTAVAFVLFRRSGPVVRAADPREGHLTADPRGTV